MLAMHCLIAPSVGDLPFFHLLVQCRVNESRNGVDGGGGKYGIAAFNIMQAFAVYPSRRGVKV